MDWDLETTPAQFARIGPPGQRSPFGPVSSCLRIAALVIVAITLLYAAFALTTLQATVAILSERVALLENGLLQTDKTRAESSGGLRLRAPGQGWAWDGNADLQPSSSTSPPPLPSSPPPPPPPPPPPSPASEVASDLSTAPPQLPQPDPRPPTPPPSPRPPPLSREPASGAGQDPADLWLVLQSRFQRGERATSAKTQTLQWLAAGLLLLAVVSAVVMCCACSAYLATMREAEPEGPATAEPGDASADGKFGG